MGKTGLARVKKGIFAPYGTGNPFSFPLFGAKKKIGRVCKYFIPTLIIWKTKLI